MLGGAFNGSIEVVKIVGLCRPRAENNGCQRQSRQQGGNSRCRQISHESLAFPLNWD